MRSVHLRGFVTLICLLGLACSEEAPRSAAEIEAAVESYLADRTDLRLDQMQVKADRIRYDGNHATVSVSIVASDDPKAAMRMLYQLRRDPDGWKVLPPEPVSSSTAPLPPNHPPTSALPPGHPPTVQPSPELPPGHPPLDGGQQEAGFETERTYAA